MNTIKLEQLGFELKRRRGERGLRDVAAEIGISSATLSRIEAGKQPDLETFSKLCKWLNLDAGEVLGCGSSFGDEETAARKSTKNTVFAHFRAESAMDPKTVQHLSELILVVQDLLQSEDDPILAAWDEFALA